MNNYIGMYDNTPIYISDKENKKYYALVGNRKVYFGDTNYQQYKDIFGYYKYLDHLDKSRRDAYYKRHVNDVNNYGHAGYFAARILWPLD